MFANAKDCNPFLSSRTDYLVNSLFSRHNNRCRTHFHSRVCPRMKVRSAPIVVPTEERIDKIISAGTQKWITIFSICKHGLRPDEVSKITLRDVDLERGILSVRTSK